MFINSVNDFSRTYFYEPDPKNYAIAVDYFSEWQKDVLDKIVFRNCCIGKENGTACFNAAESEDWHISETGSTAIPMVSLDEDILEPVSFIKMDIEGFERDALEGAKNHITSEHPKLAICVYHKPDDLWEIPKLIKKYDEEYTLYLRAAVLAISVVALRNGDLCSLILHGPKHKISYSGLNTSD